MYFKFCMVVFHDASSSLCEISPSRPEYSFLSVVSAPNVPTPFGFVTRFARVGSSLRHTTYIHVSLSLS